VSQEKNGCKGAISYIVSICQFSNDMFYGIEMRGQFLSPSKELRVFCFVGVVSESSASIKDADIKFENSHFL
jgi:hypothetical protein